MYILAVSIANFLYPLTQYVPIIESSVHPHPTTHVQPSITGVIAEFKVAAIASYLVGALIIMYIHVTACRME